MGAGLPNIGNTCYLNTALQIIYSMKDLRTMIMDFSKNHSKAYCHQKISNIMKSLLSKSPSDQKRTYLENLKRYL